MRADLGCVIMWARHLKLYSYIGRQLELLSTASSSSALTHGRVNVQVAAIGFVGMIWLGGHGLGA